ncbi:MAG: porin [Planctomycetia bacterium]|nr:porin [Planctomycetia bacterium]
MKLSKLALAGAIAGSLSAGTAYAQSGSGQPALAQQTALDYNSNYAQDDGQSPSDQPPAAAPAADGDACRGACSNHCNSGCGLLAPGSFLNPCCDLNEQRKLIDCFPCAKCNGVNIAGWLAQSYTWNPSNPADRFNGPVGWTDRSNDYQLNQLYFYAEKTTNTDGCGTDFGYRADVLFGSDYRFNTESGLETRGYFTSPKISTQRFYGTSFPQFYVEAAVNDWKFKVGHYFCPVGYEFVPSSGNFFSTKAWCPQNEPYTMTGAIATYTASENVAIGGGVMHGWDNFDNSNPNLSFIGTYTQKFSDGSSLNIDNIAGNELNQNHNFSFRYLQTNVYSRPLKQISDKLTWVGQIDFAYQANALVSGHQARWYALNQYLFYKVSDCMTYGIRYEWFRDEEGFRVGGLLDTVPDGSLRGLSTARSGYQGSFYEITLGPNYKYSANTTIRPYARFDWFSGTALNGPGTLPFNNGFGNSQSVFGFDVITLF